MELIGFIACALTIFAFFPQTYRVVKTRQTRDISLPTYLTLIVTGTLWTIYGFGLHDPAIYITNLVIAILSLTIVMVKLKVAE